MASIRKLKSGKVRAQIHINGIREDKTFLNVNQARRWSRDREAELSKLGSVVTDKRTLGDVFTRYAEDISPTKRGSHWEVLRLNLFVRDFPDFCAIRLVKLSKEHFQQWISDRLEKVKPSTVNRELNIISHCLSVARDDWSWISHEPMKGLKRPKNPPSRTRRVTEQEVLELCLALGYTEGRAPNKKREFVGAAFIFAIETAMRAGEICSLTPSNIYYDKKIAHLEKTKNGDERYVPLSDRAISILKSLPLVDDESPVFQLNSGVLSTTFRDAKLNTTLENITFHDSRHEATTRLAGKMHVLSLAKVTGHRNINELMTYYDESAEDIAKKLGSKSVSDAQGTGSMASNDDSSAQLAQQLIQQLAKTAGISLG